jgi:hypothetical protein
VRDLLHQWDLAREEIIAGRLAGFHLVLKDDHGGESIYAGGVYRSDHEAALRAVLKTSMVRMLSEDEPLPRVGTCT